METKVDDKIFEFQMSLVNKHLKKEEKQKCKQFKAMIKEIDRKSFTQALRKDCCYHTIDRLAQDKENLIRLDKISTSMRTQSIVRDAYQKIRSA